MPTMQHLSAKLSRIGNPAFPSHAAFRKSCEEILGFMVTAVPSENGQRPGVYLPDNATVFVDQMGEGIPNIVSFLADLAISQNKIFLVEELENDLHPTAIKALLELIVESSKNNQFVISTHSSTVLCHLGAVPGTKVFNVKAEKGVLPTTATIHEIDATATARLEVLRELGYAFSDFDLWDGWLILEESSAERLIRDYLIPWFVPKLARVRTIAAGGNKKVEPVFEDFVRLARFTHLETAYANRAWVRIDGDQAGKEIVSELREKFTSWNPQQFCCFSETEFERYFPQDFKPQIDQVLSIQDKKEKRQAKQSLLSEVRAWLDADESRGRAALSKSASEIIDNLKAIEQGLMAN